MMVTNKNKIDDVHHRCQWPSVLPDVAIYFLLLTHGMKQEVSYNV